MINFFVKFFLIANFDQNEYYHFLCVQNVLISHTKCWLVIEKFRTFWLGFCTLFDWSFTQLMVEMINLDYISWSEFQSSHACNMPVKNSHFRSQRICTWEFVFFLNIFHLCLLLNLFNFRPFSMFSFFSFYFLSSFFAFQILSTEPAPFSFKLGWGLTTPSQSSSTSSPTTFLHQSPSTTITTTTAASTSTENLSALTSNHVRHSTDIRDPAESCKCRW